MRIDGRHVAVDDDGIEVKRVGEAADDRQLRRGRRAVRDAGRRARHRVGVGGAAARRVFVGHRRIRHPPRERAGSGGGPRRNAEIERVDEPVVRRVVDADPAGVAERRRTRKVITRCVSGFTPVALSAGLINGAG